jgi:predicted HAD superfamily Cof-like phosphohydrolase
MKSMQDCVRDFHVANDYPVSPAPIELRDAELRAKLMAEEPIETVVALVGPVRAQTVVIGQLLKAVEKAARRGQSEPSLVEAIGECMDSLYVTLGTMETFGFTASETMLFYEEVHRANMAKPRERDESGKVKKPEGWSPPDIAGVLQHIVEQRMRCEICGDPDADLHQWGGEKHRFCATCGATEYVKWKAEKEETYP